MGKLIRKQLSGTLIFILAGLLFFAIGSGLTYRQRALEKQGIEAQGEVVALDENYDSDGSTFAPVVRFTTGNGQSVEFKTTYYSSPPEYEIGQSVTVVYPSEEPQKAIIKGDGQLLHIIFMLVGGVLAAIGFSLMYSTLRDSGVLNPEK